MSQNHSDSQDVNPEDAARWFEAIYAQSNVQGDGIPWAKMTPNPHLVQWLANNRRSSSGRQALVVGCGLGDDAEVLAEAGYTVTAFDSSPSAIKLCQERFPNSSVQYVVGNVLNPPRAWLGEFDFVYESLTVQSLPRNLQAEAMQSLARLIAPDGELLVMTWLRMNPSNQQGPPWLLLEEDLQTYHRSGLHLVKSQKTKMSPLSAHFTGLYVPKMAGH